MRKMMGFVLAGAAAFVLTACSGNNASQSTEAAATTVPETQTEAAAETESGSYTVTDVRGKKIEFDAVPERVATVGKPFPSIYYAIEGATDNIVGCNPSSITAYNESVLKDMYPQLENAETDWCTKDSTVNVEELLKLRPDVIFIYSTKDKEIEKMENAGLKVVALRSAELDSVKENLQIIAAVCQKEERGEQLVQYIDEGIEEVTSCLADVSEEDKPTVVELYSDMNVSVKQYDHWMISSGAKNPAEDLTGKMAEVDMEQMLLWNPDIIYITNFSPYQPEDLYNNTIEGHDWSTVKAVQEKKVYKYPLGMYRWFPPASDTPLVLKWMAQMNQPELFADVDMEEEVRAYYNEFYHVELTDEEIDQIFHPASEASGLSK